MEISNIETFIAFYERIKQRTTRLFNLIPPDKIEWTYQEGKFTMGDIIRHLANIERYMYAETVQLKESTYSGCGIEFAQGYKDVTSYYERMQAECLEIFSNLSPEDLLKKCKTPAGHEITTWKWLRAMIEHEIHHRGQLYMYLAILGIKTPPIFGLTSEEVIERSV